MTVSLVSPSFSPVKIITLLPGRQKPCSLATFSTKLIRLSYCFLIYTGTLYPITPLLVLT